MSPRELTPEVVELLAEVAQATRTKLFGITPAQRRRQPFERVRVSAAMAGLSSPERQLVRVHRAELARLLHEAFWIAFPTESAAARDIHVLGEVPPLRRWSSRAAWVLENLPSKPTLAVGAALVERCLSPDGPVPARDLLFAALRLVDSEDARNDIALHQIARGELATALLTIGDQLSKRLSVGARALAWLNLGHCHCLAGDLKQAKRAYVQASRFEQTQDLALPCAFAFALRTGDERDATVLALELDGRVPPGSETAEFVRRALLHARYGDEELRRARSVLDRGAVRLGRVSGAIADVFRG